MITLVTNIRQLVTPIGSDPVSGAHMGELAVREGVTMVLRGDRIATIGAADGGLKPDHVIDAAGGIVVPGLVDPCVTAGRRGRAPLRAEDSEAELGRLRVGMHALLRHGTTSAEVRAVAQDDEADLVQILACVQQLAHRVPLRLSMGFLGAPRGAATSARADRISTLIGEIIPLVRQRRLASTCIVLCGQSGYGRKEATAVLRAARGAELDLKVQASGADAEAVLAAADLGAGAIDHLSGTLPAARPLAMMKNAGTIPILLPGLALAENGPRVAARPLVDAGLAVALGSSADLGSGGVFSLWTGVALSVRELGLSLGEAIVAATLNAAAAIGISHAAGTLEPGKFADLAILELDDYRRIPDYVVGLPIRTVIVGGKELTRG